MSKLSPYFVVVLGGTSKVWRLVQPFWSQCSQGLIKTCVVARTSADGVDAVFETDVDVGLLPQCKAVISLWGVTSGSDDGLAKNVELSRKAQEIASSLGADRVLHASSGAVYAPSEAPLTEDSETRPRAAYGVAKLDAEQVTSNLMPKAVQLRFGNVAGADSLFRSISTGQDITLDRFANGATPARSYVAPDDLALILCRLCDLPLADLPSVLNVAGPRPVEMGDIAAKLGAKVHFRDAPVDALPVQHLATDRLKDLGIDASKSSDPGHLASFSYPERQA